MIKIKEQIFEIVKNANKINFDKVILNISNEQQKTQIKSLFEKHMLEITDFCIQNFIENDKLEEKFIKQLHKIHFPPNYKETQKTISGDGEVVIMIPGVYKSLNNFYWIEPKNVKKEMTNLINYYNENINKTSDKYYIIINFLINFLKIHPFGNGNARVISIISDCMLVKSNLEPIYFNLLQNTNKKSFEKVIIKSIENENIDLFIDLIKKNN